jgi:S1-C subfamily serine protease
MRPRMTLAVLPPAALVLAACSVVPVPPEGLPDEWVPAVSPSPIDDVLENNPLGFTPEEQSSIRIRNVSCDSLSTGSGFILDEHTIVTNRHVVEGFLSLGISTDDGGELTMASVATSQVSDLAIITTVETLTPLVPLADEDPRLNDFVMIVGYPGGNEMTTSTGTVLAREDDNLDNADHVFRVTAEVEHGSSGSAAYNAEGEVFGLLYAGEDDTNYGIIIPLSIVEDSLDSLTPLAAISACS